MTENIIEIFETRKKEAVEKLETLSRVVELKKAVSSAQNIQELETAISTLQECTRIQECVDYLSKTYSELYKINDRVR